MLMETSNDELVLIPEDAMESCYLNDLFNGEVRVICSTDFIRKGFHTTDEQESRIIIRKC